MKICAQCNIKYPDALDLCPRDGTPLPAAAGRAPTRAMYDQLIGTTVDGRYLIEAKLGEGGMGLVYAARHVIIDKRVAMKVLKLEAQEDPTAGQRFIQEAKSASKIGHANIVDITDFGTLSDGSAYFVMEFLEGQTLGQAIRQGTLGGARVVHIAAQVARGLLAAHGKGIIHRDLKPENIFLLERDGQADVVKVVDFGIAKVQEGGPLGAAGQKLTQAGMVLGTPEYMSPEQATGKETDHRVDEYALGCIMYEMLTGDVPYRADTAAGTLTKHVFEALTPPRRKRPDLDISPTVDAIVVKAMAKRPDDRYPSMKELVVALEAALAEIDSGRDSARAKELSESQSRATVAARELTPGELAAVGASGSRSRTGLLVGAGLGGLALLAGGAWLTVGRGSRGARTDEALATTTPSTPTPAAIAPATAPVAAPAAAVHAEPLAPSSVVELTLRSSPVGAEILQDGRSIGETPKTITLPPALIPVAFVFRKPGFQDTRQEVVPNRNQDIDVALARAGGRPAAGRNRAPGAGHTAPLAPTPHTAAAAKSERPASAGEGEKRRTPSDLRDPFANQ